MKRTLVFLIVALLTACGGSASPTEVINTWANAVQKEDYSTAKTVMLNPHTGWDLRASDVHRGLTYRPHQIIGDPSNGQTVMVQWETDRANDPILQFICAKVHVQDGQLLVDTIAACTKGGTFDVLK